MAILRMTRSGFRSSLEIKDRTSKDPRGLEKFGPICISGMVMCGVSPDATHTIIFNINRVAPAVAWRRDAAPTLSPSPCDRKAPAVALALHRDPRHFAALGGHHHHLAAIIIRPPSSSGRHHHSAATIIRPPIIWPPSSFGRHHHSAAIIIRPPP